MADYSVYYETGVQDCGNAFELDDFRDEQGLPEHVVQRVWAQFERDGMREQWLEQNADDLDAEGLSHEEAYLQWSRGWRSCAVDSLTRWRQEFPRVYYVEKPVGRGDEIDFEIIGQRDSFEGAVEYAISRMLVRGGPDAVTIYDGDRDGPNWDVARIEDRGVAEMPAREVEFEAVLTIDGPERVPPQMVRAALDQSVITVIYDDKSIPPKSAPVLVQMNELPEVMQRIPEHLLADDTAQRFAMLEFGGPQRQARDLLDDDTAQRFKAMELGDDFLKYNPRSLTQEGRADVQARACQRPARSRRQEARRQVDRVAHRDGRGRPRRARARAQESIAEDQPGG